MQLPADYWVFPIGRTGLNSSGAAECRTFPASAAMCNKRDGAASDPVDRLGLDLGLRFATRLLPHEDHGVKRRYRRSIWTAFLFRRAATLISPGKAGNTGIVYCPCPVYQDKSEGFLGQINEFEKNGC